MANTCTITLRTSKSYESKRVALSPSDALNEWLNDVIFKGGEVISESESATYAKAVVSHGGERYEFYAVAI